MKPKGALPKPAKTNRYQHAHPGRKPHTHTHTPSSKCHILKPRTLPFRISRIAAPPSRSHLTFCKIFSLLACSSTNFNPFSFASHRHRNRDAVSQSKPASPLPYAAEQTRRPVSRAFGQRRRRRLRDHGEKEVTDDDEDGIATSERVCAFVRRGMKNYFHFFANT